mgnify:CR=1 FL=1
MLSQITKEFPRLKRVDSYIRRLLEKLPQGLYYHNADHTLNPKSGVVVIADNISRLEDLNDLQRELVLVSAYFHDTGFKISNKDNEPHGAQIASGILPSLGYSSEDLKTVKSMILSTDTKVQPKNLLEKILKDADTDNLGRNDFFEKNTLLRKELGITDIISWYEQTIKFLKSHSYYTQTSKNLRKQKKAENLQEVKRILQELTI